MRRFGLLKQKSFMRSACEVETQFAIATSAISILLLERDAQMVLNRLIPSCPDDASSLRGDPELAAA